ncbi:MAG: peptidylprolyl isomerase, partial [Rhodospirillales bacterium]
RPDRARARAEALTARLIAAPDQFEEVAGRESECPSALEGGLLGDLPRGKLYAALDAVLFSLKAGAVAGPVETEAGYHVLYCESILAGRDVPFTEAASGIRAHITEKRRKAAQRDWLASIGALSAGRMA